MKMNKPQFKKHVAAITIPDGWTAEWAEHPTFDKGKTYLTYTLVSPKIKLEFTQYGDGHTHYLDPAHGNFWFNFDRTGVESSFYHAPMWTGDEPKDLNALVSEQIERVAKQLAYRATAVKVPTLGYTVAPEGVAQLQLQIKQRGYVSFSPSGFGTGYLVSKRRQSRFDERAKPELEKFLGYQPLYVS